MKAFYRGFLISMLVLLILGVTLLVYGAVQHINRPLVPTTPGGTARYMPRQGVVRHV